MITLTHDEVHPLSGLLFIKNFLVMVDEYAKISQIIEQSPTRNNTAGGTMKRWCVRKGLLWDNNRMEAAGFYGKHP
jgi:hypothetical protein